MYSKVYHGSRKFCSLLFTFIRIFEIQHFQTKLQWQPQLVMDEQLLCNGTYMRAAGKPTNFKADPQFICLSITSHNTSRHKVPDTCYHSHWESYFFLSHPPLTLSSSSSLTLFSFLSVLPPHPTHFSVLFFLLPAPMLWSFDPPNARIQTISVSLWVCFCLHESPAHRTHNAAQTHWQAVQGARERFTYGLIYFFN